MGNYMQSFSCAASRGARSQNHLRVLSLLLCSVSFGALLTTMSAFAEDAAPSEVAADADQPHFGVTGDWGGLRTYLHDKGIDLGTTEILDFLGNPTGGTSQDGIIEGRLEMDVDVDFEKLVGLHGLTGHANAYQIHGRGLSASDLNNNITTSTGIEADRTTRLFDLWLQQNFLDDNLSIRVGQIAADDEFITSQYSALFMNSVYGWPSSLATNLPGGGPAYALAAPGARVRVGSSAGLSFQTAVFDGDPSGGPGDGTAQFRNPNGTKFPLNHGAFIMSEVDMVNKGDDVDLSGTYKIGGWYHTEKVDDARYGTDGLSLADPGSNGIAQRHDGNYGFYGVIDQMLWHTADSKDHGVAGFTRFLWNPSDRNTVAWQVDAGINVIGMIPNREDDIVGVAFTYLPISNRASGLDRDTNDLNGSTNPVRNYESQIELTYQAPITPWLTVQPDFQYIIHPGGNVADPTDPASTRTVGDAAIIGVRLIAKF